MSLHMLWQVGQLTAVGNLLTLLMHLISDAVQATELQKLTQLVSVVLL